MPRSSFTRFSRATSFSRALSGLDDPDVVVGDLLPQLPDQRVVASRRSSQRCTTTVVP